MTTIETESAPAYDQILHRLFQRTPAQASSPLFAFTAANPGEGVTYVVDSLARELAVHPSNTVLVADARRLAGYAGDPATLMTHCRRVDDGQFHRLEAPLPAATDTPGLWQADVAFRHQCLGNLRNRFSYVLLDCPSPKKGGELFGLASLADGVVIVVQANRTTKEHIRNLERTVELAKGKIAGFVLNKREYIVPAWLYDRL